MLKLAGQVGFLPDSLAESLYHVESNFASLGIKAPAALGLVKIAAQGAQVGGADLVDVTNALSAAVASGIPGVQNYSQAMGSLNAIVGAGDMKMQDLAEAMGSGVVAVVKGYGLSLADVGAALDVFGDNNIRGAVAATDLRMAVQSLAVPAAAGKAALASMGLSMTSLGTTMRNQGLLAALEELQAKFKAAGITAKEQGAVITEIFGKKAGVGLAVLMDQMDRLKSKYPAITKGAQDFGQAWNEQSKTPAQQLKDLEAGAQALATQLGESLLPAATKVLGWANSFVSGPAARLPAHHRVRRGHRGGAGRGRAEEAGGRPEGRRRGRRGAGQGRRQADLVGGQAAGGAGGDQGLGDLVQGRGRGDEGVDRDPGRVRRGDGRQPHRPGGRSRSPPWSPG